MARRRRWPSIPVAGGTGRRGNRSGITAAEWGPDLRGRGRRGAHRSSAPHGGAIGGGGSPVRGHRRGRGRSLHGRRGAPGRGGARGGEDEAGGGPQWPARGGVPDGGRRRRSLVIALRRGAPRLGSCRQTLGQLLWRLEARQGVSRRRRLVVGSRGTTSAAERESARWRWCWRFEQSLLLTEDKAGDKDCGNRRTWRSGMACAWRS
jgi:hypothetical protein